MKRNCDTACALRMTIRVGGEGMPEVIQGTIVLRADSPVRDVDAEEDLDVVFQIPPGSGPSTPKSRAYARCSFDVAVDL
jgi:hypothetical protein